MSRLGSPCSARRRDPHRPRSRTRRREAWPRNPGAARRLLRVLAPAIAASFLGACTGVDERDDVLGDSSYVEVMARLARIHSEFSPRDSVRADSARRAVLAELDVDAGRLARYATRYGADAAHMTEVWKAVNLRVLELDSLAREREEEQEQEEEEVNRTARQEGEVRPPDTTPRRKDRE